MKQRSVYLGLFCSCLIIFAVCTLLAVSRLVPSWELRLLYYVYNLPDGLHMPFYALTMSASIWIVGAGTIILAVKRHVRLARILFLNVLITAASVELIKNIIMRPRPYLLLGDLPLRAFYIRGYGFPSGHTAVAAAVATTLWLYLPRNYRPLLAAWVLLVGVSRMYLGVHAPLDIAAGAAAGCAVALATQFVIQHLGHQAKVKPRHKSNLAKRITQA